MKIYSNISLQRKFEVLTPKCFIIVQKKVPDLVFFSVRMLSETIRSIVDVIREAEKEGTSDK